MLQARPPLATRSGQAAVAFAPSEPVAAGPTCTVDGQAVGCAHGSFTQGGFAPGAHALNVALQDAEGNASTVTIAWTVDRTSPAVTILKEPPLRSNEPAPFFTMGVHTGR